MLDISLSSDDMRGVDKNNIIWLKLSKKVQLGDLDAFGPSYIPSFSHDAEGLGEGCVLT